VVHALPFETRLGEDGERSVMDYQIVIVIASALVVLAVVGLAWFVLAKVAKAAPAKVATVVAALATFVGAVATVIRAFRG
jgi:flagellar basal body-associated protein FliL